MVRLREIPRTAAFAWAPGASSQLLVTGTRAGAVDDSFSDETKLELWNLNLDDQDQGLELQPLASINTDSRFYDIAWGPPNEDHPKGIIAGALENGSLDLWDAEKLMAGSSDAFIARTQKHSGAIKSLQFNPLKPQILATAGAKGELFVYDVNDVSNPFRLGTAAARSDDLECVAWNRKVPHILATGGTGGFVTVWDLKTKKASLTLNNSRKAVSAIAWDPNNSTKLLTATPDDNLPVIFLWDLRNSNAPERTLRGHEQGVLSLSWCQQDSDLLISCGKDNRTIVWNPQTGERYGEFPEATNWTFLTRFNPDNPNLSATASFDGKITIQTLQNTNPSAAQAAAQSSLDGEDFFAKAQTQPQGASFSLPKAPRWFERPTGASFGFGGKLVIFKPTSTAPGQPRASKVQISQFSVDSDVGSATEAFEASLREGNIISICETHLQNARTEEEKADWLVMETLVAEDTREQIVKYLGLADEGGVNGAAEDEADEEEDKSDESTKPKENGADIKKSRLSSMFADNADGDDFLSGLTSSSGAKADKPFQLFSDDDSAVDKQITKALMLGDFTKATSICLKEDRMADAFIIANCGGKELVDKVQSAYLAKKEGSASYLRLLGSVIAKNLWDVVHNADLKDWKETMATLCTFASAAEFPDLCEALGDRIFESGLRKDASFCYMVGSKLEKVVSIWITELEEAEQAGMRDANDDSTFSVHARSLQQFIEKVSVFRHVTKFHDAESDLSENWKLAALYDKYTEYADIVAAHGQLSIAQRYLDLVPAKYPAAELARNRVRQATQKAAPQPQTAAGRPGSRPQKQSAYMPPQPGSVTSSPLNPYAPAGPGPSNQYTPPQTTPYQPPTAQPGPYAPPQASYAGNPVAGGYAPPLGYTPPTPFGAPPQGPPRNTPAPVSMQTPSKAKELSAWNDVPMVTKVVPRRSTPSAAPITSPFPGQQGLSMPPPAGPYQRTGATPPPPPPKGPAPQRVTSPLAAGPPQASHAPPPRPSSTNMYAPPAPVLGGAGGPPSLAGVPSPTMAPQVVQRVASPYNAPPAGPPPSNRYAPAPAAQQQQAHQPQQTQPPRPPPAQRPHPPAGYAPPQPAGAQHGAGGGPPYEAPGGPGLATGPPPRGPPPAGRQAPQPEKAEPEAQGPPRAHQPQHAKHPPGDRSHIPAGPAQRVFQVLSADMQRVAARAPASFAPQVKDAQKRLGLLFDHLNNGDLVSQDTIGKLEQLANALEARSYDVAQRLQVEIQRDKVEECGQWMVGVKRLISMSKATPA